MKKLLAMLMAAAMLVSFAACGGDKAPEETTAAPEATTVENVAGDVEETEAEVVTEVVTEIVTNADGETEIVTEIVTKEAEKSTKDDAKKTTKEDAKKTTKEDAKKTTEAEKVEDPSSWSKAEVLKYYQDATAKVVAQKPGYQKTRQATDNGYKAGAVLSAFKGEVFKFLGIGSENKFDEKVAKGTNTNDDQCGDYLRKSTLTEGDVSQAKAVKQGSNYVITINVKAGTSQTEGGKNTKTNAPIDKSGICAGNTDRGGYDHKTAAIVYDALDDIASGLTMYEKSNNGKVVATIDAATGEIQKLVISWDASAEISKVYGSEATLAASTTVTYSNFGW
ncbi:MAG: hypothetical protein IJ279_02115 [Clostridia bacterium]|nr:hypothetical protein [Clostridia bacterium]